jgi:hypothetical protein
MSTKQEPQEMHGKWGWVLTDPLIQIGLWQNQPHTTDEYYQVCEKLAERCRRAEDRQAELTAEINHLTELGASQLLGQPVTEDELRAMFEKECEHINTERFSGSLGRYKMAHVDEQWLGFSTAARLFGKLKEVKP